MRKPLDSTAAMRLMNTLAEAESKSVQEPIEGVFIIRLPISERVRHFYKPTEITKTIQSAAEQAIARLEKRRIPACRMLRWEGATSEQKRAAARSMLGARGGKATAAKQREQGFPNLQKAQEAGRRWRAEQAARKIEALQSEIAGLKMPT